MTDPPVRTSSPRSPPHPRPGPRCSSRAPRSAGAAWPRTRWPPSSSGSPTRSPPATSRTSLAGDGHPLQEHSGAVAGASRASRRRQDVNGRGPGSASARSRRSTSSRGPSRRPTPTWPRPRSTAAAWRPTPRPRPEILTEAQAQAEEAATEQSSRRAASPLGRRLHARVRGPRTPPRMGPDLPVSLERSKPNSRPSPLLRVPAPVGGSSYVVRQLHSPAHAWRGRPAGGRPGASRSPGSSRSPTSRSAPPLASRKASTTASGRVGERCPPRWTTTCPRAGPRTRCRPRGLGVVSSGSGDGEPSTSATPDYLNASAKASSTTAMVATRATRRPRGTGERIR